ncbi:MAG: glycosyltransferase family 39 protein [Candidatus Korarchaeota archaeon]|nr:glycosyltransferase family 39 protein [Candidatus Korarchaeota archaeon]
MARELSQEDLLIAAALSLASAVAHVAALLSWDLMPGVDGPYYLIQVRSILSGGGMVYGDPPLLFYLAAAACRLVGDLRLGVSLTVATMCGLSAAPSYALVKRLTGSRVAGAASALALSLSPQMFRMAGDLMKNASGILFVVLTMYWLHSALACGENWWRSALLSSLASYLAFLTHSLDFALTAAFALAYLPLTSLALRSGTSRLGGGVGRRWALSVLPGWAVSAATAASLPWLFTDVRKGIAFLRDLLNSAGEGPLGAPPRGPLPPKPPPSPPGLVGPGSEYLIAYLALGILLAALACRKLDGNLWGASGRAVAVAAALAVGAWTLMPSLLGLREWAWRFLLVSCVPISVIVGVAVGALLRGALRPLLAAALLLPLALQVPGSIDAVHPRIDPVTYADLIALSQVVPPGSDVRVFCRGLGPYWVEYLLSTTPVGAAGTQEGRAEVFVICEGSPAPQVPGRPIFRGQRIVAIWAPPRES